MRKCRALDTSAGTFVGCIDLIVGHAGTVVGRIDLTAGQADVIDSLALRDTDPDTLSGPAACFAYAVTDCAACAVSNCVVLPAH